MKELIGIVFGIIGLLLIQYLQRVAKENYKNVERFDFKKFLCGLIDIFNPTLWAKEFSWLLNLRKAILIGTIFSICMAFSYWKGKVNTPITVVGFEQMVGKIIDINHNSNKAIRVESDGTISNLTKQPDGTYKFESKITLQDSEELAKAFKPYGWRLKPCAVVGFSSGGKASFEAGVGLEVFKFWNWKILLPILTNKGYSGGLGYSLEKFGLKNTSVVVDVGQNWKSTNGVKENKIGAKIVVQF